MTRSVRVDDLIVRLAQEPDADALATFECSSGPWYEAEVQDYVQRTAHPRAMATSEAYRLLLTFQDNRLIACGAHHNEGLMRDDAQVVLATRLHVFAIASAYQGAVLDDGTRLSDALLGMLINDAMETRLRGALITAIVAQDNLRSIALCERNGLRSQVRYDTSHVRLSGLFTR